ncbi:hypothetical protein SteCoe_24085 [Stentor coeruleus]|uniref:PPM-type phosphatase domain-containing protein n=1 Tax=Stentor coeruleus TaxID=5963 RepID=A0A1R2BID2_9CILI|nr:hypothetical protein SteCoe_24085 [Stentor coeruleus]
MGSCSIKTETIQKEPIKSIPIKPKSPETKQEKSLSKDLSSQDSKQIPKQDTDRPQEKNPQNPPTEDDVIHILPHANELKRRSTKKKLTVLSTNDDAELSKEFERELSFVRQKSIGKKEQGSLIIIKNLITFTGQISSKTQSEFEDKLMVIEGDDVKREHLLDHGLWVSCKKGLKPESPNQDDFVVVIEDSSVLLGVFDGHGTHGHEVSNFLHKAFPRTLINSIYWEERPDYALAETFPSVHNELVSYCSKNPNLFDCTLSGSTATVIYTRDKKIYAAHTGDSRAVLGRRIKGKITAVDLTRDHKPTLEDENQRINRMGGEVRKLDNDIPYRVFFKGKHYPGIAMSRTIGDQLAQTVGVTCIPDVSVFNIEENDEFIIACSDGVWEFISSQEAVEEISRHNNPRTAAENLATLAWNYWIKYEEDVVDDITVVLAYLKNQN